MLEKMAGVCLVFVTALGLVAMPISAPAAGGEVPARVLILSTGADVGAESTGMIVRRILASTGRFDARLCESPSGLSPRTFEGLDLIVLDAPTSSLGQETDRAIENFVASGKGLVVTQRALGRLKATTQSAVTPAFLPAIASNDTPMPVGFIEVKLERPEHPILRGLKPEFRTADAILRGLEPAPGVEVLATARSAAKSGGEPKADPVVIVSTAGKGRVVGLTLGHDASAMHEPEFRAILARASEWAATGTVTLPADTGVERPKAGAVKALLITGGHDHEVAFYDLFSGYRDLDWIPILTSATAFKTDPTGKYDVIIMYDFTRDLEETAKKNLRSFVEKGGGVVVLHHALLNYQNWDWWTSDVVGGSYRLSRTGTTPSSSVKDHQQIFVTPVTGHPITSGIEPFHIDDEAYKGLRMSPKVRPLLATGNPTSDPNLAWLGPDDRYRVVAIQLGHGHSAFGHPSYRALVHNAILWAAGKLK